MVPAGTRRACFHAGMSYVRDKVTLTSALTLTLTLSLTLSLTLTLPLRKAHHAWLLEEASSSDGGSNPRPFS